MRGHLVIVEVKSCKADFKNDNKWPRYLEYASQFYFCCTEDIADYIASEVPKDVGVIALSKTSGYAYVHRNAKKNKISGKNRRDIITRLAWRGGISKRTTRRTKVFI